MYVNEFMYNKIMKIVILFIFCIQAYDNVDGRDIFNDSNLSKGNEVPNLLIFYAV